VPPTVESRELVAAMGAAVAAVWRRERTAKAREQKDSLESWRTAVPRELGSDKGIRNRWCEDPYNWQLLPAAASCQLLAHLGKILASILQRTGTQEENEVNQQKYYKKQLSCHRCLHLWLMPPIVAEHETMRRHMCCTGCTR